MANNPTLKVRDLRDLHGFSASLIVDAPAPTARTPGDRVVADEDDVFCTVLLPGGVSADIALTGAEYRAIAKAAANEALLRSGAQSSLPLEA